MYDVIVIGLGAHGSSCAAQLAARGAKVLGIEQHHRAHALGSSHGHSRAIRLAYFEDARFKRSFKLFRELAARQPEASPPLLTMTGALSIGPEEGIIINGTLRSALQHQLDYKLHTTEELRTMYPQFHLSNEDTEVAVHETEAGYLNPEACILAYLRLAETHGAELHFGEEMISWTAECEDTERGREEGRFVRVRTARGEYLCRRLVLSVGPWAPEIYGRDLRIPFSIDRENGFPIFIWDFKDESGENRSVYGFPHQPGEPGGVKVALHLSSASPCTPSTIRRDVSSEEVEQVREVLRRRIPALAEGKLLHSATCMYTSLPDGHFLVCPHPQYSDQVVLVSPCSGHGFKFSAVIGEVVADLALTGSSRHDISLFALDRHRWEDYSDSA